MRQRRFCRYFLNGIPGSSGIGISSYDPAREHINPGGMQAVVLNKDESLEFVTPERCSILELSNDAGDPDLSVARARVAAGVTTAWHCLEGIAERYVILSGSGRVEVGGMDACVVTCGDVVRIPPGVRQRICNTGEGDLVFLALCTPRFRQECYRHLEA